MSAPSFQRIGNPATIPQALEVAEALQLTADDLLPHGIIDRIIAKPVGGAHTDPDAMGATLKAMLIEELQKLLPKEPQLLVHERIEKFSAMGVWNEV